MKPNEAPNLNPQEIADETHNETIRSWERTFSGILASNGNRREFEDGLLAFIDNVNHYAHPDRPGVDEGDKVFHQKAKQLLEVVELCQKGQSFEEVKLLFDELNFEDKGLQENLEGLFSRHYPSK